MIGSRNRNIVVKSQFNINGSRGKNAGKFVSDYVSRDSATDTSMAYVPPSSRPPVQGDGVAFTLDATAISRDETLRLADRVQELHETGTRAIQQMVISFDHDYLVEQGIVPETAEIRDKGDYQFQYDDIRLRHAVRQGIQSMIDAEGYRDGRMVAAIQHDTLHLHVHAVVYENHPKLSRLRGKEEKGVIKESSMNQLAHDLDRNLSLTRLPKIVPTQRQLLPKKDVGTSQKVVEDVTADSPYVDMYLQLIEQREREEALQRMVDEAFATIETEDDDMSLRGER